MIKKHPSTPARASMDDRIDTASRYRPQRVRLDVYELLTDDMKRKLNLPFFVSGSETLTPAKAAMLLGVTRKELKHMAEIGTGPTPVQKSERTYYKLIDVLRCLPLATDDSL